VYVVPLVSQFQELDIHQAVVVLSHFKAVYMVQGIFIKKSHINEYRIVLFDFDKESSSVHIDTIILIQVYTKIINNTQENKYFTIVKNLNQT
jgi:hypothetical protein